VSIYLSVLWLESRFHQHTNCSIILNMQVNLLATVLTYFYKTVCNQRTHFHIRREVINLNRYDMLIYARQLHHIYVI